jgi:hypothetical protein
MRKPIYIAAPLTTHEERLKQLGISKARQKELQVLVDQFKAEHPHLLNAPTNVIEPEKRRKRASAA